MIYVQQHAGYKFSEWLISAILSPFPLPEDKSCLFSMLGDQQSAFSLFFTLQTTCNHYKEYANKVSAQSFSQNLSSVLTTSALKWKDE